MDAFPQYSGVKVKTLLKPPHAYDGWGINLRPPVVGDTGTVVEVLRDHGVPTTYVVECVNGDGTAEWLADFIEEELEDPPK